MSTPVLSVREIEESDIELIANYWLSADADYLQAMGVDLAKMPAKEDWKAMLASQLSQPYHLKKSYCIIWLLNGKPIGHSNVNKIIFGQEAFMHLHIWDAGVRKMGYGTSFLTMTIPYFFKYLQLVKLYCEPYALNESPNKTLPGLGFTFIKEYVTTPGYLNFKQPVRLWELTKSI